MFKIILQKQPDAGVQEEVRMLLISTYFVIAKKTVNGYIPRDLWLETNSKLTDLIQLLKKKDSP